MSEFNTFREIDIQVVIGNFTPAGKQYDALSPSDPKEIEISAWMNISKGKKNYKFQLTQDQVEALDLEQEATDYVKRERLSTHIDRVLEERREVPDRLREALGSIMSCHAGRAL